MMLISNDYDRGTLIKDNHDDNVNIEENVRNHDNDQDHDHEHDKCN